VLIQHETRVKYTVYQDFGKRSNEVYKINL